MTCGTTKIDALATEPDNPFHALGTSWTVTRHGAVARCALSTSGDEWEVRVIVNGEPLLWKRCRRTDEAFTISEDWKMRMLEGGWAPAAVVGPPLPVRRQSRVEGR
jgi:hypothetical protein